MKSRRVPVVLQLNAVECGAACLAMILGYFGRKTRLEECRSRCDPGRDGVSAKTIVAAARGFALRTRAMSLTADNCGGIEPPCIVFWNNNHFVVLERWGSERVSLVDPSWGRREISRSEFESGFSCIALQFEPTKDFDKRADPAPNFTMECLRRIWQTPGTAKMLGQILFATLLLQAFGFALPLFTKWVVDDVMLLRAAGSTNLVGAGALVVALTTGCISYLRAGVLIRLERHIDSSLMLGFFEHLLSLPYRFFQQRSSGDLLMRLASNSNIREALASHTTAALLDGALVIVFLVALIRVSAAIALAAIVVAALEMVLLLATARRLQCLVQSDVASQAASQSCLIESLGGIETLKASGAEQSTLARWSALLVRQLDTSQQRGTYTAKVEAAMTMLRTFSPLFLLWLGGRMVADGSMTLGAMLATNALAAAFLQPVASLVLSSQRLQLAGTHIERIADVMRARPEQAPHLPHPDLKISGRIRIRDMSFRYDMHSPNVLEHISFDIYPGQKVALVGKSGSGKSTLGRLLLGLYMPVHGEILYDGLPTRQMNLRWLRGCWGTVLQNAVLFSASIRENIAFHDSSLAVEDLKWAARIAEIDSDIAQMPMQYETRIDEGGGSLSGGQKQRLAIARALAIRPRLLMLDEATSHMDVITEAAVNRNLDTLSCTRVVVAHRLSAIQNADLIVVLDKGRVVEKGTHSELLALGGYYALLVMQQGASEGDECGPCPERADPSGHSDHSPVGAIAGAQL